MSAAANAPTAERRARRPAIEGTWALSPIQQGVLFDCLYQPRPGLYTSRVVWAFGGELDPAAFERAWRRLFERHSIFRTGFFWDGLEEPVQVVLERLAVPLEVFDWRDLERGELERRARERLAEDRERGFDFRRPPLMRLELFHLPGERWRFVWTYHHLVMDGWSEPIALGELLRLYAAEREGRSAELAKARPYTDYVAWVRGRDLAAAERYWRRTLEGFEEPTPLGLRPRGEGGSTAARELRRRLGAKPSEALRRFARERGMTLNTVVQGAWALMLASISGRHDVLYGTTVAGRPAELPGVGGMIGPFINTLPVRARLETDAELAAWLGRFQAEQAAMREHEYSPLVEVLGWSEVPRGTRLFENIFVFQNLPIDALASAPGMGGGGELREEDFQGGTTTYALSVDVVPARELMITMTYDPERLESAQVEAHLETFTALLERFPERPEAELGELLEALEAERRERREREDARLASVSLAKLRRARRRGAG